MPPLRTLYKPESSTQAPEGDAGAAAQPAAHPPASPSAAAMLGWVRPTVPYAPGVAAVKACVRAVTQDVAGRG